MGRKTSKSSPGIIYLAAHAQRAMLLVTAAIWRSTQFAHVTDGQTDRQTSHKLTYRVRQKTGATMFDCLYLQNACAGLCIFRTHPFNGPFSGTTRVSRYQKGKSNLDFTEARDSEWQWHQLGHMQVCTSLQTDNHASTHHSVFLQAGCHSCGPTNSVKALKAL